MRFICFICFAFFLFYGCRSSGSGGDGIYRVDLVGSLGRTTDPVLWNDVAKKISVVPLQTDSSCLLGNAIDVLYAADTVVLLDLDSESIFVFDSTGRFLSKIDRRGKGPGEYEYIFGACVVPGPLSVYINTGNNNLLHYDLNGNCLSVGKLAREPGNSEAFVIDSLYTTIRWDFGPATSYVTRYGLDGTFRDTALARSPREVPGFDMIMRNSYTVYPDRVIVQVQSLDTVYAVGSGSVSAYAYIDLGNYRVPNEWIGNSEKMKSSRSTYIPFLKVRDLPEYLFVDYVYRNKWYVDLWSKRTGQLYARCGDGNSFGLRLENGASIPVYPRYVANGQMVSLTEAYKLSEKLPGLKEDDNPVLILMWF